MREHDGPKSGLTLTYQEVREKIRDGDVLCFQGSAGLSRFIMRVSGGKFSHAGIAFWWGDRLMVLQVELMPGVQALPVSRAVGLYPGRVEWYSLKDEHRQDHHLEKLRHEALRALGDGYSVSGLFLVGLHYLFGTPLPRPDKHQHEYVCSEYVAHCFSKAGLDLDPDKDDNATTPMDLALSNLLVRQGVLHDPPNPRRARALPPR